MFVKMGQVLILYQIKIQDASVKANPENLGLPHKKVTLANYK